MNRAIEIHDSTLGTVETRGRDIVILLKPAYVLATEGQPLVDPGTGWEQDVELVINEGVIEHSPTRFDCWLSHGRLSVGEVTWDNAIPLPIATSEPVTLGVVTEHGEALLVHGRGAYARPIGEARYIEELP